MCGHARMEVASYAMHLTGPTLPYGTVHYDLTHFFVLGNTSSVKRWHLVSRHAPPYGTGICSTWLRRANCAATTSTSSPLFQ